MMRSTRFDLDAQPTAQLPFPKVEKTIEDNAGTARRVTACKLRRNESAS